MISIIIYFKDIKERGIKLLLYGRSCRERKFVSSYVNMEWDSSFQERASVLFNGGTSASWRFSLGDLEGFPDPVVHGLLKESGVFSFIIHKRWYGKLLLSCLNLLEGGLLYYMNCVITSALWGFFSKNWLFKG